MIYGLIVMVTSHGCVPVPLARDMFGTLRSFWRFLDDLDMRAQTDSVDIYLDIFIDIK